MIITHDLRKQKTKRFEFNGQRIQVLAIESLINMKKESGRPQDLEDIKALEVLRG